MFYEVGVVVDRYKQFKGTTEEIKVSRDRANLSSGLIAKAGREGKSLKTLKGEINEVVVWHMEVLAPWQ